MRDHQRDDGDGKTLVVGSDPAGALMVESLSGPVQFLGLSEGLIRRVRSDVEETAVLPDPQSLTGVADDITAAIVATPVDSLNLLYARRLRADHELSAVVVRVTDPRYRDVVDDTGFDTVCTAPAVSESILETYTRVVL
jgi:hypothetical protein